MNVSWNYQQLKALLKKESLPAMVVDLDHLDHNITLISEKVKRANQKLRIATKSIRVPFLIDYILKKGGDCFEGLMCFSVDEAKYLNNEGFDNLLIAYPAVAKTDLEEFFFLTQKNANVVLMVDCVEHIHKIEDCWKSGEAIQKAKVCIDIDMSVRTAGQHLGVFRSPVNNTETFKKLFASIQSSEFLTLAGIMGYEAQVAGLGDQNPFSPLLNPVKRIIRKKSIKAVRKRRKEIVDFLHDNKVDIAIINGGGSGSLSSTLAEPWLTEVTAGSGFLQSHLFDYYIENKNVPAFVFALEITRFAKPNIATCKSGGFVASGNPAPDKWPVPYLPAGIKMVKNEGFGEVQTPIVIPDNHPVELGDPLFFRPAKAGEIAERFNQYILIRNGEIIDRVPTYRGMGKAFY